MYNFFIHDGSMGDIVYAMPTILSLGAGYLQCTKKNQFEFMESLLLLQPYIYNVTNENHLDDCVKYNLSKYRKITDANPKLHLALCHAEPFNAKIDIENQWLFNIEPKKIDDFEIIINVTPRYHDHVRLDYSLLEKYPDRILFIGNNKDYRYFIDKYNIGSQHYKCTDALEIAQLIAGCKLFIGNQSLCFAIAEALKVPRVLEVYHKKPNCNPHGQNGYTNLSEELINKYINQRKRLI